MDPAAASLAPPQSPPEDDEWDAEGFEIPSLNTNKDIIATKKEKPVEIIKPILHKTQTENLYLGPHGAKPGLKQQVQQQDNYPGKKQRFKQKLRDADQRGNVYGGRENKVEVIRDLVGSGKSPVVTPRGNLVTTRSNLANPKGAEWLDPHCQESLFERTKTRG